MSVIGILVVIFVFWLIFGHPSAGLGQRVAGPGYGYPYYGGGIGVILVILLVLYLLGVIRL